MRFERKHQDLLPRRQFLSRLGRHLLISIGIILGSLGIGVLGYWFFESMSLLDAVLNASMILGGMGPVTKLETVGGKLFASFYALFSAFVFIGVAGVLLSPLIHRILHRFHLDEDD
jgi:hypothetical protein